MTSHHAPPRAGGMRGRGPKAHGRSDARILEDVCDRLTDARDVDASDVEVTVEDAEVCLRGSVLHRGMRRRAEEIAQAVGGVRHVRNELQARPQGTAALSAGFGTPAAGAFGLDAQAPAPAPERRPAEAAVPDREPALDRNTVPGGGPAPEASAVAPAHATVEPSRTVAALFDDPEAAERAVQHLEADGRARVTTASLSGQGTAGAAGTEGGVLGALKSLFGSEAGERGHGGTVVAAAVTERRAEETAELLRRAGAIGLDTRRGEWRAMGWREYEPLP